MTTYSIILAWKITWSLLGYSLRGRKELDMTNQLEHTYHSLVFPRGSDSKEFT